MNDNERFVLQHTVMKLLEEEFKDTKAGMKGSLEGLYEATGGDRISVKIGRFDVKVSLCEGRKTLKGEGSDFLDFMESKGMAVRAVSPDWKEEVDVVGGSVVWRETGEVVPGAFVDVGASYPKVSGLKASERMALLKEASALGLMGGELPLLGGDHD